MAVDTPAPAHHRRWPFLQGVLPIDRSRVPVVVGTDALYDTIPAVVAAFESRAANG